MVGDKAYADLHFRTHGSGDLKGAALGITGINQALEIGQKAFRLFQTAAEGALRATKAITDTGSQFEKWGIQFEVMLGSAEKAKQRIDELFSFSVSTPFTPEEVIAAGQAMEAYGVYSVDAFRKAGDAAAGMGKDFQETVLAVASAATGEMERLKAFGITTGMVTAKLGHEIRRSTVEEMRETAQAVADIMGDKFGGATEKLALSLSGMISTLSGKWTEFKKIVADAGVFETIKDIFSTILKTVNELFDSGKAEQAAQLVGRAVSDALWVGAIAMAEAAKAVYNLVQDARALFGKGEGGEGAGTRIARSTFDDWVLDLLGISRKAPATGSASAGPDVFSEIIDDIIAALSAGRPKSGGGFVGPEAGGARGTLGDEEFDYGGRESRDKPFMISEDDIEEQEERLFRLTDAEREAAQATLDEWSLVHDAMRTGAGATYNYLAKAGAKWRKGEKIGIRDIATAWGEGARQMLGSWLGMKAEQWGMSALEHVAAAIGSIAYGNVAAAAKHGIAAAKYGALGTVAGIASGATGVPAGMGDEGGGAGYGTTETGAGEPSGTRVIDRTTGVRAQTVNVYFFISHQGTTVYGDAEAFYEEGIRPMIMQDLATQVI